MSSIAHWLLWDKEFVTKRIEEQKAESLALMDRWASGEISLERARELNDSVTAIQIRFECQLRNINKLK